MMIEAEAEAEAEPLMRVFFVLLYYIFWAVILGGKWVGVKEGEREKWVGWAWRRERVGLTSNWKQGGLNDFGALC